MIHQNIEMNNKEKIELIYQLLKIPKSSNLYSETIEWLIEDERWKSLVIGKSLYSVVSSLQYKRL